MKSGIHDGLSTMSRRMAVNNEGCGQSVGEHEGEDRSHSLNSRYRCDEPT